MTQLTRTALLAVPLLSAVLLGQAPPSPPPPAAPTTPVRASVGVAPAGSFDIADCKTCHEKSFTNFVHTRHAKLVDSCASCHGDVAGHMKAETERGERGPIFSMKSAAPAEAAARCLTCHDKGAQAGWHGGVHERKGLSCVTCHSVHEPKSVNAQLKTARDADTCFTCHPAIRARNFRTSHHPIREGKLDCASCHDPHSSTSPKMISAESVNEKCLSCHTEKRGPFLWEHAPVRENCLNCHDPHGSNHDKLLVAKQPYLCQRCHLNTRHPGTLYDFQNTLAGAAPSNRDFGHACRNCHVNIHGSNAPSGPYFGR